MLIWRMAYQSEIEKLEQRYRENPDQWFAALADSYRKAGQLDLALEVVRGGLERRPNYVSGHIVLGRCLLQKPDDEAAASAFERVLALDAENVIALKALAEIHERAGRWQEAQRWVRRLLEVDPANEEAEQTLERLSQASAAAAAAPPEAAAATAVEEPADASISEEAPTEAVPAAAGEPAGWQEPAGAEEPPAEAPLELAQELELGSSAQPPVEELELVIEKSQEADTTATAAPALEPLSFEPPAPEEAPPPPPDLEPLEFKPPAEPPPADVIGGIELQPFDSELAWGTGERLSRQISQQDLEAAERAREAALDVPVRALPGLEGAEVPPVGTEEGEPLGEVTPEGEGQSGAEAAAAGLEEEAAAGPASDLPLIFPDEPAALAPSVPAGGEPPAAEPERLGEAEEPAGAEPEPVVTETMARLYASQGLWEEARGIYQQLAEQHPEDTGLQDRMAALEGEPARPEARVHRLSAAYTGGPSVRELLAEIFGPGQTAPGVQEMGQASAAGSNRESAGGGGIENSSSEGAPAEAASGAPTVPASDEVSLAAVFGEEPAPLERPSGDAGRAPGARDSGFSFDEFFGGQRPAGPRAPAGSEPSGGGDDDEFRRWLKSLKS